MEKQDTFLSDMAKNRGSGKLTRTKFTISRAAQKKLRGAKAATGCDMSELVEALIMYYIPDNPKRVQKTTITRFFKETAKPKDETFGL